MLGFNLNVSKSFLPKSDQKNVVTMFSRYFMDNIL